MAEAAPDLKVVSKPASLAECLKQAIQEVQQEENARVEGLLGRLGGIKNEFDELENDPELQKSIQELSEAQRKQVLATLSGNKTALNQERDEILADPGVQLVHLQELTQEVQKAETWGHVIEITEAAVSRGWFKEPKRNGKGNINFRALEVPETDNKAVKDAAYGLKRAINRQITKLAKASKEIRPQGRPESFNPPRLTPDKK